MTFHIFSDCSSFVGDHPPRAYFVFYHNKEEGHGGPYVFQDIANAAETCREHMAKGDHVRLEFQRGAGEQVVLWRSPTIPRARQMGSVAG